MGWSFRKDRQYNVPLTYLCEQPGVSLPQAAKIAGVKRRVVLRWCRHFGLPHRLLSNGHRRIDPDEFKRWLETSRPAPTAKRPNFHPHADDRAGVIYALIDPRPERFGQVRYIGKSADFAHRRRTYLQDFRRDRAHSPPLRNWFKKLKRLGFRPQFKILGEYLFGLNEHEQEWIDRGRKKGWPLLNCKGGGLGGAHDEATRQRLREIQRSKLADQAYVAAQELASARRRGFATVEEWKAERQRREQERSIGRNQWVENMRKAAERASARRLRSLPCVPLTCRGAAFIPLTQGKWAIIDAEDWPRVGTVNWSAQRHRGQWLAKRSIDQKHGRKAKTILLAREVMHATPADRIHHKPGCNLLDCRKCSLFKS